MKTTHILAIIVCIFSIQANYAAPSAEKETIVVEGKLGTIKEERVKSVQSSVTYTPSNGISTYSLIGISDSGEDGLNEHIESETVAIPSWTLFSW